MTQPIFSQPTKKMDTTVSSGDAWALDYCPIILPALWQIDQELLDGRRYINDLLSLMVILSGAVEQDGHRWMHLSVSHARRLPRWRELVEVKELFLGTTSAAYQVIPPREKYININPRVLHLWCCCDATPLPDFTRGGQSI